MRMILIAAAALAAASPVAAAPAITVFDVPGATATEPAAINDSGTAAGTYKTLKGDPCGHYCAFLRAPDGTITTFGVPGAKSTSAASINASGTVAGTFSPSSPNGSTTRGFLRAPDGTFTIVDISRRATTLWSINDDGLAAGDNDTREKDLGFVRAPDGTVQIFYPPRCQHTNVHRIGRDGTIVGECRDTIGGPSHAFMRTLDGTFTLFDGPGADAASAAIDIDGHDDIVGSYFKSEVMHGFIRAADGTSTSWDVPGAQVVWPSKIRTVGAEQVVLGTYVDSALNPHGFLRHADGTIDILDVSQGRHDAVWSRAAWMNASGTIVGSFTTTRNTKEHGYIRTP